MTPSSALRVTYIAAPAPVGGLERVVQQLAIGTHQRGHDVLVVGVVDGQGPAHPFFSPLADAGVPTSCIALQGRGYWQERSEVKDILQATRPDVVHTHGYRPDLLDGGVARRAGAAIVSTMHGSSRLGGLSHFWEWCQERAWRRFDAVIAVSDALAQQFGRGASPPTNVEVIPNAWSGREPGVTRAGARSGLALDDRTPVLGYVGRLIPAKGADLFVEALGQLPQQRWHAVLVGDGILREPIIARIRELGLSDRVTLTGHVDDATDVYPAFDAFVLPSRTEGTPIALFEAMGASLPIIASAVGGVPDVLANAGQILVPAGRPDALASAIATLLSSADRWPAMGHEARRRVESQYSMQRWLDRHEALYRRIAAAHSRSVNR